MRVRLSRLIVTCATAVLAACSTQSAPPVEPLSIDRASFANVLKTPALIVTNGQLNAIQYWPITSHGGRHPTTIAQFSEIAQSGGMAANGNVLAIAINKPAGVMLFDARTRSRSMLGDPFGSPGAIAIDKTGNIFALNDLKRGADVTMYAAGSMNPHHLTCNLALQSQEIAADDEGDLFVAGYVSSSVETVEFPNGPDGLRSGHCSVLPLRPESDYIEGLAVDPKTDDLIVFHDPGMCAGPAEARMTIYPKPYNEDNAHSVDMGGFCPYDFWIDADSRSAFFIDSPLFGGQLVRQVSYPDGKNIATYTNSFPAELVTIPNALPN